jgi:Bacterial proteasome activator
MSTDKAGPSKQPGGQAVTAPRLAVVLGRQTDASRICRVEAPGRVLRVWALLNQAGHELHQVSLPPGAAARLQRQLEALTGELERSVSPALAAELGHLIGQGQAAAPTADELRVEYASLLGWTGGLVIEMLSQIEAASAKVARPGLGAHPVTGQ